MPDTPEGFLGPTLGPKAWFDQWPEDWYEKSRADKDLPEWPDDSQMCTRHWAPCPLLGANGIGVVVELMQIWLTELAPKGSLSPKAMQRQLAKDGHICCTLGDARMYDIWGHWPPAIKSASSEPVGSDS
jgi:hypothetical protein